MARSDDRGSAKAKDPRLLLPFSFNDLRIPEELAQEIAAGEPRIFGPCVEVEVVDGVTLRRRSARTWPVEVMRDDDGAFLGRGWPEFAAASGAGEGWILILRHHGGGLLTVKAFDSSCCLRELGPPTPPPAVEATTSTLTAAPQESQFISTHPQYFMEKMLIPAKFVEHYIPKEQLKANMAVAIGPLAKVSNIELDMNHLHMFLAGGWSDFVQLNGITEANTLVLKYVGNMQFTVKVFEADGFLRLSKHKDFIMEQDMVEMQNASTENSNGDNVVSNNDGQKEPKGSRISLKKASFGRNTFYEVGQPSLIKKEINANNIRKELSLAKSFCDAIGLREPCKITIKTSANSTKSWEVYGQPGKATSYLLRPGWRRFCRENALKEGDTCTFNMIKKTLWHVDIMRREKCYETPSTSSSKGKSKDDGPSSKAENWKTGSVTRCDYQIEPAAWIKKKISTSKIENRLYLPTAFCKEIGILEPRTITLKTSKDSTKSWEVRVSPHRKSCHHVTGLGWKRFYQENEIKVGDICTFNIGENNLWLADITPSTS